MLFWCLIICLIVGIVLKELDFDLIGIVLIVISTIAIIISAIVFADTYLGVDGFVESSKERYKALVYKVESETYKDEFGLLNKEVIDEVQEWNEDVVNYKAIQKDFWIGIYYPNVFDQFETINYEKFVSK